MTVYYPKRYTERDLVKYSSVSYDVADAWNSFPSLLDKLKFFKKCFLSEKKCAAYCIRQMQKENNNRWF